MNKGIKYTNCGLLSTAGFAVGIMLVINPQRFVSACLVLLGITLLICGGAALAFCSKSKKKSAKKTFTIGIVEIIAGLLLVLFRIIFGGKFAQLHLIFAAMFIVIAGLYSLKLISNVKNKGRLFTPSVCVIASLGAALVIILYPFAQWLLWRYIALSVMLQSVLYIYAMFGSRAFESQKVLKERFISQLKEESSETDDEDYE